VQMRSRPVRDSANQELLHNKHMAAEVRLHVIEKGRLPVPASFRKALGIKAGDEVVLRLEDNELRITTQKPRLERALRLVRKSFKPGRSLANALIAERREPGRKQQ
jgi:AbrB family looped-hinge helix DNA binding protein